MRELGIRRLNGGMGEVFARMAGDSSCRIMVSRLPVGASIGMHCHTAGGEIDYVLRGEGRAVCDGGEELLLPGMCHYCPPGSSHSIANTGAEPLVLFAAVPEQPARAAVTHKKGEKEVLFVLLDGFAEWESAPLAAALNQREGFCARTVSLTRAPVRSIGGFAVLPDYDIAQACGIDFAGLLLIGGNSWRTEAAGAVAPLVERARQSGAVLGGICDGSAYLGTLGVLNSAAHTSNQLEDLQDRAGAAYTGAAYYRREQAVRDGRLVTANGTAALEFGREVLLALGAMEKQEADAWYRFFQLGYYEAAQAGPQS